MGLGLPASFASSYAMKICSLSQIETIGFFPLPCLFPGPWPFLLFCCSHFTRDCLLYKRQRGATGEFLLQIWPSAVRLFPLAMTVSTFEDGILSAVQTAKDCIGLPSGTGSFAVNFLLLTFFPWQERLDLG